MSTEQARELKPQEFEFETMNLQGRRPPAGDAPSASQARPVFLDPDRLRQGRVPHHQDPDEHGAPIAMAEGDRLTIRVFSGVNVCSFACKVGGDAAPVACTLANVSVTGARIDSRYPLPVDSEVLTLAFALATPPTNEEVPVETLAAIWDMTVARPAPDKPDVYSYGVQSSTWIRCTTPCCRT